jgi:ribonuclease G
MKGRVIALGQLMGRNAAALMVDGTLEDLLISPPDGGPPAPGTIYRAICDRPFKGQGGMMVRLPGTSGFLRQSKGLRPGQALNVQVTSYAEPGKAVPLTDRVLFKSRYAIVTPNAPGINISRAIKDEEERVRLLEISHDTMGETADTGLIIRSAAQAGSDQNIADDITQMLDIHHKIFSDGDGSQPELLLNGPDAHELAWREWGTADILADSESAFDDHDVHSMLDDLMEEKFTLPNAAYAFIQPTRALVAVDVNTGPDTSPAAALKANIALARDLPRQLRCRGLSGQISIDFAPLAKKDRHQIDQVLKSAFRKDPIETALAGWTPLGHFELQRKHERLPLHETLQT